MRRLVATLAALLLGGCFGSAGVVRRDVDGRDVTGRWISPEAYALYLEGALAEREGQRQHALSLYQRVLERDPDAAEAWARLGALTCEQRPSAAERYFQRAAELAPRVAEVAAARARCALDQKQAATAIAAARRALALEPLNEDHTLTLVAALDLGGEELQATRLLDAWLLWGHASRRAGQRSLERARRSGDAARAARAARLLGRWGLGEPSLIEAALLRGALDEARQLALTQGTSPSELAALAWELGLQELARTQAALVLAADPSDADAWIVTALCAEGPERAALPPLQGSASKPSERLLGALLERAALRARH